MCWTIQTPTPDEGARLTGLTPEEWQRRFEIAYWRQSALMLDSLGIRISELRDYFMVRGWGTMLNELASTIEASE